MRDEIRDFTIDAQREKNDDVFEVTGPAGLDLESPGRAVQVEDRFWVESDLEEIEGN